MSVPIPIKNHTVENLNSILSKNPEKLEKTYRNQQWLYTALMTASVATAFIAVAGFTYAGIYISSTYFVGIVTVDIFTKAGIYCVTKAQEYQSLRSEEKAIIDKNFENLDQQVQRYRSTHFTTHPNSEKILKNACARLLLKQEHFDHCEKLIKDKRNLNAEHGIEVKVKIENIFEIHELEEKKARLKLEMAEIIHAIQNPYIEKSLKNRGAIKTYNYITRKTMSELDKDSNHPPLNIFFKFEVENKPSLTRHRILELNLHALEREVFGN